MKGTCGLCRKLATLQKSHFLPSALFKAVAQVQLPYDDAPVLMDITKGTAVQSNFQPQKHFLCGACEQLFSSRGERQVIDNCHRKDGAFKLRDGLRAIKPSLVRRERRIYLGHELPAEFDAPAYTYFVLSVLWRGSAADWPGAIGSHRNSISPQFEEEIRLYLLGESSTPKDIAVNIYVNFDPAPVTFLAFPTHGDVEVAGHRFNQHGLVIPGMRFIVWIGPGVSIVERQSISSHHGYPTFFEWRMSGTPFHQQIIQDTKKLKSKGKLAKEDT
jgi:hypothetical protein